VSNHAAKFNLTGCGSSAAKVAGLVGVKRFRDPNDVPWAQLKREVAIAWERLCERKPVYRRLQDPVFGWEPHGRKAA